MKNICKKVIFFLLSAVQMSPMWCMLPDLNNRSDSGVCPVRKVGNLSTVYFRKETCSTAVDAGDIVQADRRTCNGRASQSEPSTRRVSPTPYDSATTSYLPPLAESMSIRKARSAQVSPQSKSSFYKSSNSSSFSGSLPDLEECAEPTEEDIDTSEFTYSELMTKETFELVDIFDALKYLDSYRRDAHDKDRFNGLYRKTYGKLKTMIQDDRSIVSTPIDNGEKDLMSFIFTELENPSRFSDLIWLCIQKGAISLDTPLIGSHETLRTFLRNMNDWKFAWFVQNAYQPQYAFVDRKKERALLRHVPSDVCLCEAIDSLEKSAQ